MLPHISLPNLPSYLLTLKHYYLFFILTVTLTIVGKHTAYGQSTITVNPLGSGQYEVTQADCRHDSDVMFRFFDGTYFMGKADSTGKATVEVSFIKSGGNDTINPFVKTTRKNGSGGADDKLAFPVNDPCEDIEACAPPEFFCVGNNNQQDTANFKLALKLEAVDMSDWYFYVAATINRETECDTFLFEYDTKGFFNYVGHSTYAAPNGSLIQGPMNGSLTQGTITIDGSTFPKTNRQKNIYFRFEHNEQKGKYDPDSLPSVSFKLIPKSCQSLLNNDCPSDTIIMTSSVHPTSRDPNSITVNKQLLCLPQKEVAQLRYTVHFQNEGIADAHTVFIEVPIDTVLFTIDMASIYCKLGNNNACKVTPKLEGNSLQFCLSDISLPGMRNLKTHNDTLTQGSVHFTLNAKNIFKDDYAIIQKSYISFIDFKKGISIPCTGNTTKHKSAIWHNPILAETATVVSNHCYDDKDKCPCYSPFRNWLCKNAHWLTGLLAFILLLLLLFLLLRNGRRS
jgi:hypothetical protein